MEYTAISSMDAAPKKPEALVIDDDPGLQLLVQVVLERNGFNVSVTSEGTDGVQQALAKPPDVVILDIMMAGLNGFEVCKILRSDPHLNKTAIVFTSGKSYKPDRDKAMEIGADAFLIKPFSSEELLITARQQIKKRKLTP